jgi:hypothetical protein
MSEKATLLTSIPPVKVTNSQEGGSPSSLLPNIDLENESSASSSVGVEPVADQSSGISGFEMLTYVSFVMGFLLAGAAAVLLFKKAGKLAGDRFVGHLKLLGIAAVLMMLHGFFATYLYASHLNHTVNGAPLLLTMAIWVLVGPVVGYVTNNMLTGQDSSKKTAALIDAILYCVGFLLVSYSLKDAVEPREGMLPALLGLFFVLVPVVRLLLGFKSAKATHPELSQGAGQSLIFGLVFIPVLLPILALLHVFGLSDALTLFLISFIIFCFLLVVTFSITSVANRVLSGDATVAAGTAAKSTAGAREKKRQSHSEEADRGSAGSSEDPIIQFLNDEAGADAVSDASGKSSSRGAARSLPPRKPGNLAVPKKSGPPPRPVPNAPSRIKAPAKPKKRF